MGCFGNYCDDEEYGDDVKVLENDGYFLGVVSCVGWESIVDLVDEEDVEV